MVFQPGTQAPRPAEIQPITTSFSASEARQKGIATGMQQTMSAAIPLRFGARPVTPNSVRFHFFSIKVWCPNCTQGCGYAMAWSHPSVRFRTPNYIHRSYHLVFVEGGGLLARFDRIVARPSMKKQFLDDPRMCCKCHYQDKDFLVGGGSFTNDVMQYSPSPNINETKFHKGFHKRPQAAIGQDIDRLRLEMQRENRRDERVLRQTIAAKAMLQHDTFNPLTGEGKGRECEFPQLGRYFPKNVFIMKNEMFFYLLHPC